MNTSHFHETLCRLSSRAASSVVARGRIASPELNALLLRQLSALPGEPDALLTDPVFEAAQSWEPADCTLHDLAGQLLHADLVSALDEARTERMPRQRRPWSHQLAAWEAARDGTVLRGYFRHRLGQDRVFHDPDARRPLMRTDSQGACRSPRNRDLSVKRT